MYIAWRQKSPLIWTTTFKTATKNLNLLRNFQYYNVPHKKLNEFLEGIWRSRRHTPNYKRRRGITTGVVSAVIGGTAGIITTKLISAVGQDDNLKEAMKRTEEILDSLTERTNLLDINQKRILLLLKENQKRISKLAWKESTSRQRNIVHSQINSLLIHVNDHMDYLRHLLNSKERNGAYILALDDYERGKVIQSLTSGSQVWKGTKDQILDYRLEMLGPHDLCLILNVPLLPPLQSIAAVRPFVFPSIEQKKANIATSPTRPLFTVSWKLLCKI